MNSPGRTMAWPPLGWTPSRRSNSSCGGLPAHLVGRLVDDGQERVDQPLLGQVVEAHQRDVVRDPQRALAERAHGAEGDEVVGGEEGRGARLGGEDLGGHPVAAGEPETAVADQLGVEDHTSLGERALVARDPVDGRRDRPVAGEHADAPVTELQEVPGQPVRARHGVRADLVDLARRHAPVEDHDGDVL